MKLGGWTIMLVTMILLLSFVGIDTSLSPLAETVGIYVTDSEIQTADMESSSFWDELFNSSSGILVTLGGASSIGIGLYIYTKDRKVTIVPFIIWLGGIFITSFWTIIFKVSELNVWWMTAIATLLFGALSIGYVFACLDYYLN